MEYTYVSIRQHTAGMRFDSDLWGGRCVEGEEGGLKVTYGEEGVLKGVFTFEVRLKSHAPLLCVFPRQHTSAYVSIRQHTASCQSRTSLRSSYLLPITSAYVSIRQHTSASVSICQHTSAYVSICQHTSAYASIRQHTPAYASIRQHTCRAAASVRAKHAARRVSKRKRKRKK